MKIMWFVATLEQKGGGERFVLESVDALRVAGHQVTVVCDRLSESASFDGRYDLGTVVGLEQQMSSRSVYLGRVFSKFRGFFPLLGATRKIRPDLIICQSEFDAIKIKLVSRLCGCRYRVFVFGQMFQFKSDISKYSTIFRRHLKTIASSRPGYRDTVSFPPPSLSWPVWLANEIVSRLKLVALRGADKVFVLSNQVKWEVSLLYRREASVVRAAFDASYIDEGAILSPRSIGTPVRFLSVCRLVDKKRVDVIIRGFEAAGVDGVLHIVGGGAEAENLREIAESSSVRDRVVFLGAVDDKRLAQELEAADCFISMDIGDFDISVVEAMGKGRRVIVATDFDLSAFGDHFDGVVAVTPEPAAVGAAMRNLGTMTPPSARNFEALHKLTWQWLASECVR